MVLFRKELNIVWFATFIALLMPIMANGGGPDKNEKPKINWAITLEKNDKRPYGGYLAWTAIPIYFSHAKIIKLSTGFRYNNLPKTGFQEDKGRNLLVLIGLNFNVNDEEWEAIYDYASKGNEVLIFASKLDNKILESFAVGKQNEGSELYELSKLNDGSSNKAILSLTKEKEKRYGYQGRSLDSHFILNNADTEEVDEPEISTAEQEIETIQDDTAYEQEDTNLEEDEASEPMEEVANKKVNKVPEVLGYAQNEPNFLRFDVGYGHITLHAAPLVMSNYFLVQPGNKAYLDGIWQGMPADIKQIYWQVYLNRVSEKSNLSSLLKHKSTRAAFYLALITLLLYVLFSLRRRQRIVPVIPPIENTSVSFVETIGRLYYNKADHKNIAEKMIQHFLDWLRSKYYMDISSLNQNFANSLAAKSGQSKEVVQRLMENIHHIRLADNITEAELNRLYLQLETFYQEQLSKTSNS